MRLAQRLFFTFALAVAFCSPAAAQYPGYPAGATSQSSLALIAPTVASPTDSSNRIATTAWVNSLVNAGMPLASGKIWIGSVGNVATAQTLGTGIATWLTTPSSANLRGALADETGTGLAYFQGGDIGTPSAGVGTNLTALNASALTSGTIPAARTNGHQNGTATNDNAAAGEVGEYMENVLAAGSAVPVTTATAKTVAQITLTVGDWDVSGMVNALTATTTSVTGYAGSLSTTTNALDTNPGKFSQVLSGAFVPGNSSTLGIPLPAMRFSVTTNTTVFLVAYMNFTASTMTAYGIIRARRVR